MATNRIGRLIGKLPNGMQARMVAAFLLVSLLPMLFAAELASYAVSKAFDGNVREWLRQTSGYFLANTREAGREADGMARFLAGQPEILSQLIGRSAPLPDSENDLLNAMGYDLIVIADESGHQLYASKPVEGLGNVALSDNIPLMQITYKKQRILMTAGTGSFRYNGQTLHVLVGSWLDDEFLGAVGEINALDIRLYLRDGDRFVLTYSARGDDETLRYIPQSVLDRLKDTNPDYERKTELPGYYGLYTALHAVDGSLSGVLFCGLRRQTAVEPWLSRQNLVVIILVVGTALAIFAGLLMSRILTGPVRELVTGVQAVISGDYTKRVAVSGRDEIAELAAAFNQMTSSLEHMQELEAELRRQDRFSALGQVAVGIAHEVRNPLGIIKTSAELLHKRIQAGQPYEQLLSYIIDEVRRIDTLIRDFLAFAKPRPAVMHPFDIRDVIERVCKICAPELERCHIATTVTGTAENPMVLGDQEQIHQAFLNLILNAIEAMPNGGALGIFTTVVNDRMAVRITDTGPGVDPKVRDKLFSPFFTTKENGTGLGLAKVYSIMEAHGGAIEYSDAATGGATFILVLPLASPR